MGCRVGIGQPHRHETAKNHENHFVKEIVAFTLSPIPVQIEYTIYLATNKLKPNGIQLFVQTNDSLLKQSNPDFINRNLIFGAPPSENKTIDNPRN